MCHDAAAVPPAGTPPVTTAHAGRLELTSADGTAVPAWWARPDEPSGLGVVVLPDNRGLSGFYERLTVRLAEQGHAAVAFDYFARTAGADHRDRGPDFPVMDHLGRLTRDGLYADTAAAAAHLRGAGCRATAAVGFCFGGRLAFLCARPEDGFAGVVGLYGWPEPFGPSAPGPTQLAGQLTAPILALWAGADEHITPAVVARFDAALTAAGVPHEFVTYPDAPHGFFEAGHPDSTRATTDAWRRILTFLDTTVRLHPPTRKGR